MSAAIDTVVHVFAKPPSAGIAKTRLASVLGDEGAAALARAFLLDTWDVVRAVPFARPVLAITDALAAYRLDDAVETFPQGEGDLGARMERALRSGLRDARCSIVVGTDCPGITVDRFARARDALADADVFVDPTRDGGFYLVAVRTCPEGLFDGIAWSRETTCDATIARIRSLGLRVAVGPGWFDVDDAGDLVELDATKDALRTTAPRTVAFLDANTTRLR